MTPDTRIEEDDAVLPVRGRTRWKVFALVMSLGLCAAAALFVAMAHGALAVSFLISDQPIKSSAERIEGTGFISYGAYDKQYDGDIVPVTVSGLRKARITGLCQSVVTRGVPLVGTVTVKLTAGRDAPVEARDFYSDVAQSSGTVTYRNHNGNIAAGASTKGPGIQTGDHVNPAGSAQEADTVVLTDVEQIVWASSSSYLKMTGFKVRVHSGLNECF